MVAKWVYAVLAMAALAGIGIGVGAQPVAPRTPVRATPVDAAWYASLPVDPEAATAAFLARVPVAATARADALWHEGYAVLALRLAVLAASIALVLYGGVAARMRDAAHRLTKRTWLRDGLFTVGFLAILLVLSLPVEIHAGFVRYRHAGLSHASFPQWLGDYLTQWAVNLAFYVVGIVAIIATIRWRPNAWPAWATLIYVALSATYTVLSPLYIEPLFNRFTPLPDGGAKEAILALARANGVPAGATSSRAP